MELRHIGLIVKRREPRALPVVKRIAAWSASRGITAFVDARLPDPPEETTPVDVEELAARSDLIVVLGGDGTMLAAARIVGERGTPVLGVNFGTLGYLTEFTDADLLPALEEIHRGECVLDTRVMIECTVERRGRVVERTNALNDVVINKSALARIIEIDCWIDGRFVTYYRADGLIVSTPTGSTAYNVSAGGPILMPSMGAFVINPICPHTLSNRPLVVPDSVTVELGLRPTGEEVMATIDGQIGFKLAINDRIRLKKSGSTFNVVTPRDRNYFEVLRGKLKWGGRIDSAECE
jgi:NAD+ kinase